MTTEANFVTGKQLHTEERICREVGEASLFRFSENISLSYLCSREDIILLNLWARDELISNGQDIVLV